MGFHLRRASPLDVPQLLALTPTALPADILESAQAGALVLAIGDQQNVGGLVRTVRAAAAVELLDLTPQPVQDESRTVFVDVITVNPPLQSALWSALLLFSRADPTVESVVTIVDRSDTDLLQSHARAGARVSGVVPASRAASPWRANLRGSEGLLLQYEIRHGEQPALGKSKQTARKSVPVDASTVSGTGKEAESIVKAAIEGLALPGVAGSLTNEAMRLGFMELGLESDDVLQLVSRLNAKLPLQARLLR